MSLLTRGLLGSNIVVRGFIEGTDVVVIPGNGPASDVIVIYGSPVLELVEAVDFTPTIYHGWEIGLAELTWLRAIIADADLVKVESVEAASMSFVGEPSTGFWRVTGPYVAQAVGSLIQTALTGAQAALTEPELDHVENPASQMGGALLPDTKPSLYAGKVLSSQD